VTVTIDWCPTLVDADVRLSSWVSQIAGSGNHLVDRLI
jgi:hypothetical protein